LRWNAVRDSSHQTTSGAAISSRPPGTGPTVSPSPVSQVPAGAVFGAGAILAMTPASTKNVHSVAITDW
jgi:hypothetical protein